MQVYILFSCTSSRSCRKKKYSLTYFFFLSDIAFLFPPFFLNSILALFLSSTPKFRRRQRAICFWHFKNEENLWEQRVYCSIVVHYSAGSYLEASSGARSRTDTLWRIWNSESVAPTPFCCGSGSDRTRMRPSRWGLSSSPLTSLLRWAPEPSLEAISATWIWVTCSQQALSPVTFIAGGLFTSGSRPVQDTRAACTDHTA